MSAHPSCGGGERTQICQNMNHFVFLGYLIPSGLCRDLTTDLANVGLTAPTGWRTHSSEPWVRRQVVLASRQCSLPMIGE